MPPSIFAASTSAQTPFPTLIIFYINNEEWGCVSNDFMWETSILLAGFLNSIYNFLLFCCTSQHYSVSYYNSQQLGWAASPIKLISRGGGGMAESTKCLTVKLSMQGLGSVWRLRPSPPSFSPAPWSSTWMWIMDYGISWQSGLTSGNSQMRILWNIKQQWRFQCNKKLFQFSIIIHQKKYKNWQ